MADVNDNTKNFIDQLSQGKNDEAGEAFKAALRDKVADSLDKARKELEDIEGPLYQKVLDVLGLEETLGAIDIWKKLIGVLEIGEHRPGHFKAKKIK